VTRSSRALKTIGWLDAMIGVVFLLLGLLAVSSAPGSFTRMGDEPEDFWGLIFLSMACWGVGAGAILTGSTLVRGSPLRWASRGLVSRLNLVGAVIVALTAAVGFWPDDPGSGELRLLVAPAAILLISHLILRSSRM